MRDRDERVVERGHVETKKGEEGRGDGGGKGGRRGAIENLVTIMHHTNVYRGV